MVSYSFGILYRGLIANGCKVICIHGRTRGSTKKRRCGPADLSAIATIAKTIQAEYGGSIPVISNGNITTTTDVLQALKETHPCCGVMSAEGILANPGLFAGVAQHIRKFGSFTETALVAATTGKRAHSDTDEDAQPQRKTEMKPLLPPSRLALFQEYCALSEQYRAAGGWSQLDTHFARGRSSCAPGTASATAVASTSISTGSIDNNQVAGKSAVDSESGFCASEEKIVSNDASEGAGAVSSAVFPSPVTALRPESSTENKEAAAYVREPRQIYIARQHLSWMLGKSGHGRMVRYEYIGAFYKKHVHLMQDMNAATCIFDLLCIAERCLPSC